MGGWRELLWRVAGHYDRVHVAENGGFFQSYDQGGFLQPGYTLACKGTGAPERVLSLEEGGILGAQYDLMNRKALGRGLTRTSTTESPTTDGTGSAPARRIWRSGTLSRKQPSARTATSVS